MTSSAGCDEEGEVGKLPRRLDRNDPLFPDEDADRHEQEHDPHLPGQLLRDHWRPSVSAQSSESSAPFLHQRGERRAVFLDLRAKPAHPLVIARHLRVPKLFLRRVDRELEIGDLLLHLAQPLFARHLFGALLFGAVEGVFRFGLLLPHRPFRLGLPALRPVALIAALIPDEPLRGHLDDVVGHPR